MSEKLFQRLRTDLRIIVPPEEVDEWHEEFEAITGEECDDAATTLSDEEFEEVVKEILKRLRKKKVRLSKEEEEEVSYID